MNKGFGVFSPSCNIQRYSLTASQHWQKPLPLYLTIPETRTPSNHLVQQTLPNSGTPSPIHYQSPHKASSTSFIRPAVQTVPAVLERSRTTSSLTSDTQSQPTPQPRKRHRPHARKPNNQPPTPRNLLIRNAPRTLPGQKSERIKRMESKHPANRNLHYNFDQRRQPTDSRDERLGR